MHHYIGVMSGTSLDGIDVVIAGFENQASPAITAARTFPFTAPLREQLHDLIFSGHTDLLVLGQLDIALGQQYADCVNALLDEAKLGAEDIGAVGCHGQTIFHAPDADYPFSMQIGNGNVIAARTGITTVADFRQRDMVLGGQGAPLVPAFHQALFQHATENRVIVNIGGISNITVLPADNKQVVFGFDTGPGNTLLDNWINLHRHQKFDENGQWAATGTVNQTLLKRLLADDYFSRAIPKSTGRELFHLDWVRAQLAELATSPAPEDIQATLLQFTAISIADAIKQYAPNTNAVYVCGGGAHNSVLMRALDEQLHSQKVSTTSDIGLDPDWVEATAFAWLARQTLHHMPGNLPAVTGASQATILGAIYPSFSTDS